LIKVIYKVLGFSISLCMGCGVSAQIREVRGVRRVTEISLHSHIKGLGLDWSECSDT